ncbi:MAG: hypothetical protein IPO85_17015 [Saprospiraceae bacterium]|uniref:Uncharacterized protein n=1 Tax=Candidatus Defluviibacterium haderslevense TaxID=2981993 RepID=A0A9D7SCL8_9BACT|nr:hypothetical protein [Candidatus Defluviibacterium haderslevense]
MGTTSHSPNTGTGPIQPVIVPVSGQGHGFDSTKTNISAGNVYNDSMSSFQLV